MEPNKPTITHYKKMYNPTYIGSWDFIDGVENEKPKYKEITVTIESLTAETIELAGKKQDVNLLRFVGGTKPMILKPVNARLISKAVGTPIKEYWIGKKITLYVVTIEVIKTTEDAVRIKKAL